MRSRSRSRTRSARRSRPPSGSRLVIAHGPRDVPAVALTFDDGPGAVTPAILAVLRERGARTTFNVLGARVRHGAPLVRRAVGEAHQLDVHGWRHRELSCRPVRAGPSW